MQQLYKRDKTKDSKISKTGAVIKLNACTSYKSNDQSDRAMVYQIESTKG